MLDSDSACHDVRDLKSECACARGFANLASACASSRGLDPFSPQLSWLRGPAARSAAAGPPHPNCCAALPPIGNASRPNNSVGAAACPPLCGAAAQRDPAVRPGCAASLRGRPPAPTLLCRAATHRPRQPPRPHCAACRVCWCCQLYMDTHMHACTYARTQAGTNTPKSARGGLPSSCRRRPSAAACQPNRPVLEMWAPLGGPCAGRRRLCPPAHRHVRRRVFCVLSRNCS